MEIFLIRHTAPAVASGICYGRSDVPLSDSATSDIETTLSRLPKFDRVYSSPAQRCARLAAALAGRDNCQWISTASLHELDFGAWEGVPWSQIPREQSDVWAEDPWHRAPPRGETEKELWARVSAWYASIESDLVPRCAIVAHAGPLRALRCLILNLDLQQRWSWTLAWGEHVRLVTDEPPVQCPARHYARESQ